MKNHLTRGIAFLAAGAIILLVSLLTHNAIEKWSSFLLGFAAPLLLTGAIYSFKHWKKAKEDAVIS